MTDYKDSDTFRIETVEKGDGDETQNVIIKLPTKVGNISINNTEQLLQLLKTNVKDDEQNESSVSKECVNKLQEVFRCSLCDYTSHNKHYLKQHVELVHLAERPFKCPFCDYAGKRSHSLKEHLIVHSSYRPYECHFCNATFRKKGHLTNHIKLHASESQETEEHQCSLCDDSFETSHVLWLHLRGTHKDKVHLCDVCDFATAKLDQLKVHSWSHKRGEKSQHYHQCTACDFICEKELDIMVHINSVHQGKAGCTIRKNTQQGLVILLKCSECGFTTADKLVLKEHMYIHVNKDKLTEDPQSTVPAPSAEATQATPETNNEVLYKCECGFMADTESAVLDHIQTDHAQEKENDAATQMDPETVLFLKCSECGFSTPSEDKMRTHMLIHLKTPANKKSARVPATLSQAHQSQAIDNSSKAKTAVYNCGGQCSFSSNDAGVFMAHMLTHNHTSQATSTAPRSQPLVAAAVSATAPAVGSPKANSSNQGYVHDPSAGGYRCTICSYVCDHQRTIKAHIWKHSGHKDVDYPMFQNGPLSMFDFTPVGMYRLSSGQNIIAESCSSKKSEIQAIISPSSEITSEKIVSEQLLPKSVASSSPSLTVDVRSSQASTSSSSSDAVTTSTFMKTIVSAKIIQDGHNKQVILVPAHKDGKHELHEAESSMNHCISTSSGNAISSFNQDSTNAMDENSKVLSAVPVKRKFESEYTLVIDEDGDSATKRKKQEAFSVPVIVEPMYPAHKSTAASDKGTSEEMSISERKTTAEEHVDCNERVPEAFSSEEVVETAEIRVGDVEVAMEVNVGDEASVVVDVGEVDVYTSQDESQEITHDVEGGSSSTNDESEQSSEVSQEEALSLLSLLKKGPNYNPACPSSVQQSPEEDVPLSSCAVSYDANKGLDSQSGISHSLLAAIEHLRQNSKSDDSDEECHSRSSAGQKSGKKKKDSVATRPKSKRTSKKKLNHSEGMLTEIHQNVEKISKNDLRCKLCHYITTSDLLMKAHLKTHKSKNPAECSLCDFQSKDSEELQKHILQHCKVRTYACKFCPSEFTYKSQLKSHLRVHDHRQMLLCETCNFSTVDLAVYKHHIEKCRQSSAACVKCNAKFPNQTELDLHLEKNECIDNSPENEKIFKCEKCTYQTKNQESFSKHQRWHGRTYTCDKCSFECSNYKGMSNHQRVHVEEKEQKCEFCDFVAKSVRSLKSHMKRHANDQRFVQQPLEQYVCNLCGYVCHHLPSLKCHMWRHSSDTNYSYEHINDIINAAIDFDAAAGGSNKLALMSERDLNHANKFITFRCCQCGFESLDKAVLNTHMKLHMDIIRKTQEVNHCQLQPEQAPVSRKDDSSDS